MQFRRRLLGRDNDNAGGHVYNIIQADVAEGIPLQDESVQCVVTSPPYWGLRDYGLPPSVWGGDCECEHVWGESFSTRTFSPQQDASGGVGGGRLLGSRGQQGWTGGAGSGTASQGAFCQHCDGWRGCLGLEPTPELYVEHMVQIFREVKRVLRDDGCVFLNLGDSYFGDSPTRKKSSEAFSKTWDKSQTASRGGLRRSAASVNGLKPKDLVGIPWRVAFALQADGWWLRSDIIWHKPNPMPESVTDRPTKAHEYLFLLTKSKRYYYDHEAVKEAMAETSAARYAYSFGGNKNEILKDTDKPTAIVGKRDVTRGRNRRTVWTISTKPYKEAHFATMPPKLVEPCILAGSAPGAVVLDPFSGSGTVGAVCIQWQRDYIGLELNPEYIGMAHKRIAQTAPQLFV